ncbi:hypothetical protein CANARDRAFT_6706 [[Candida] arabinofermentans NRRL YB-2248]|uniref:ENTH domain-containing protein n=1 Tax=[Candida] arabinofermentans NRRL YB-2248 TaxID=983967 RepID=A0A1E4T3B1_9ASCO|nr:hypothetical protein CANARDRAFT_6706 [[Candida] arabinofermentans NRRL YB-2248]
MRKLSSILRKPGYTEALIQRATTNTTWGPTSTELGEVSKLSFDETEMATITKTLTKRLRSKYLTQVLKALTVVYFLVQTGSYDFIKWLNVNKYSVVALRELQIDTKSNNKQLIQQCHNIRTKASEIMKLIDDDEKLMSKRKEFLALRNDMKLPTPRSSLEITPTSPRAMEISRGSSKSLEINRSELFNQLSPSYYSSSSDDEENTNNSGGNFGYQIRSSSPLSRVVKRSTLSNIIESEEPPQSRSSRGHEHSANSLRQPKSFNSDNEHDSIPEISEVSHTNQAPVTLNRSMTLPSKRR